MGVIRFPTEIHRFSRTRTEPAAVIILPVVRISRPQKTEEPRPDVREQLEQALEELNDANRKVARSLEKHYTRQKERNDGPGCSC